MSKLGTIDERSKVTMMEALALAVLKGDKLAAYMLADELIMERNGGGGIAEVARSIKAGNSIGVTGITAYNSPEFKAFCDRFGVAHDMFTVQVTLHLPADGMMSVVQEYRASTPRDEDMAGGG